MLGNTWQATSAYCRNKCSAATTVQQSILSTFSISAYNNRGRSITVVVTVVQSIHILLWSNIYTSTDSRYAAGLRISKAVQLPRQSSCYSSSSTYVSYKKVTEKFWSTIGTSISHVAKLPHASIKKRWCWSIERPVGHIFVLVDVSWSRMAVRAHIAHSSAFLAHNRLFSTSLIFCIVQAPARQFNHYQRKPVLPPAKGASTRYRTDIIS